VRLSVQAATKERGGEDENEEESGGFERGSSSLLLGKEKWINAESGAGGGATLSVRALEKEGC